MLSKKTNPPWTITGLTLTPEIVKDSSRVAPICMERGGGFQRDLKREHGSDTILILNLTPSISNRKRRRCNQHPHSLPVP
ncbi:hypothetical protein Droror1_Dr00026765, partial [Drosera rotundifolia]